MKKRPLCMMCLIFLAIKGVMMIFAGGQFLVNVPASSIFFEEGQEKSVLVQGQVYKKGNTSKVQILYLKNNSIIYQKQSFYESNLIIYMDIGEEVPIGKSVCISGKAECFEAARNPGNFDQKQYYAKQNIYGSVWCEKIVSVTGEKQPLLEGLYQLRQSWKGILVENMSEKNGAVLSAMLLSEKGEMDEEIKEMYQKNGISHALAISGLHISFIGLGIYHLLRKAGGSYGSAGILSILILSLYVMMIGFSVSVIRAYVMLFLRIGADIVGRVYDMLTALVFAAAIIVWYQPLYLADAGFWMSHGAILGILLVLPELQKMMPQKKALQERATLQGNMTLQKKSGLYGKWMSWCKSLVGGSLASVAINIALFPILLWFYFEFPVYSVVLNMIVIPLMSWVLGLGMLGSGSYLLWKPLGRAFLKICDWILMLFEMLGNVGYKLPFSRVVFGKPEWWEFVIYYVMLVMGIVLLHKFGPMSEQSAPQRRMSKQRVRRFCMVKIHHISIIVFVIISLCLFVKFPNGELQIAMLDVGQGDCIFMKGPKGTTYLIDGGSSDVDKVGKYRIEPFLKSQGVGTLDYVFLSHGDSDHYSGIQEMLERQEVGVKIKTLVFPANYAADKELLELVGLAKDNNVAVAVMRSGQKLEEGKYTITCLQPDGDAKGKNMQSLEGNAGSMVLEVDYGNFEMLCTGDVEGDGEELLLKCLTGKSYDVLKVAHHGSKNSTSEAFLKLVKPKISLISAGEDNSYGHPHTETLERLQKVGSEIYQTIDYGAIMMETDGDSIDIFPSSI
ncbi:MAG: DNA internalization-related competence protein ComEC/Rec2 [Tyzzerella sp.]|nr:DNA internalization-related competence protein ComEC/Rec2 [Tyzzerella sp.]